MHRTRMKRATGPWRLGGAVFLALLLASPGCLVAQQTGSVGGRVINATNGQPIGGAQLSLVGTEMGIISQVNGRFLLLNVPAGNYTLRCEILGFSTQEATVQVGPGAAAVVDFALNTEAISLEEILVTGTAGVARRREIGNSVASVDVDELTAVQPVFNVSQLMSAKVAGLQQFHPEGAPGAGTQVRIRGNNSITQGNSPLIYIDGVRMVTELDGDLDEGSQQMVTAIDLINPDDIDRIEVVKGAAATTLYGTQANSGVVQIFTKRGLEGPAVWNMTATGGLSKMRSTNLGPVVGNDATWRNLKPWMDDAYSGKLSGSVRGSSRGVTYFLSGEYGYEEGVFNNHQTNGQWSKLASIRTNISFQPLEGLNLAGNMNYSQRNTNWVQSGDNRYGAILNLLRSPRNYVSGDDELIWDQTTTNVDDNFVGGITATYNPITSLTNRFTVGIALRDSRADWIIPKDHPIRIRGGQETTTWRHSTLTLDYVGSWRETFFEDYTSQFSFGFQFFRDYDRLIGADTEGFAVGGLNMDLDAGAVPDSWEEFEREENLGFFAQQMVGWKDRFFLTGGIRVDGHSAFGEDYGLQPYPKVSASYILSDHEFWPEWWNVMKLRGALGYSGKAPGYWDAIRTYDPSTGNEGQPGVTPNNLGDPDLGPERTREWEFGFEGSMFDDQLSVDFSYYDASTLDALVPVQYPPSEGFASTQLANIGVVKNSGVELTVGATPYRSGNLTVDLTGQFSYNKSEAKDLNDEILQIGGSSWRQWAREGTEVPSYWEIKVQNPKEIADPIYSDTTEYYGPSYPPYNYGFGVNVNFLQRFTLYALGEGAGGHHNLAAVGRQQATRVVDGVNLWPACNVDNPSAQNALWRAQCEDREWFAFIVPSDYFKLRTVSLTYQIPEGVIPRASQAALTVAGTNLWTSTDYPGLDPELTRGDTFLARREYYHIPPATQFTASLRLVF